MVLVMEKNGCVAAQEAAQAIIWLLFSLLVTIEKGFSKSYLSYIYYNFVRFWEISKREWDCYKPVFEMLKM